MRVLEGEGFDWRSGGFRQQAGTTQRLLLHADVSVYVLKGPWLPCELHENIRNACRQLSVTTTHYYVWDSLVLHPYLMCEHLISEQLALICCSSGKTFISHQGGPALILSDCSWHSSCWMGLGSELCAAQSNSSVENHFFKDLALCTEALSCWNRTGGSPNFSHKFASILYQI